ncbi:MAG: DUF4157 domain-containing protein [Nostoc sp. CreGUA01]
MKERIIQPKKATTDSFSIPALRQPTRGFGSQSSDTSSQPALNKPLVHDISRIPLRRPQAKLTVNQPEDIYEQQADTVAQQVVGKLEQLGNRPSIQRQQVPQEEQLQMKPLANSITPLVQREEIPEEEEEELQMKSLDNSTLQRESAPEEEEEEELQMSSMVQRQAKGAMAATPNLEASINQARGSGQAMDDKIREPMEQAFGADFSGVKVHTDAQSDELNQSIQARAFTTGQDVFFRQGEYNPESRGGQELLAHELTHVVQQSGENRKSEVTGNKPRDNSAIGLKIQRAFDYPNPPTNVEHFTNQFKAHLGGLSYAEKRKIFVEIRDNPEKFSKEQIPEQINIWRLQNQTSPPGVGSNAVTSPATAPLKEELVTSPATAPLKEESVTSPATAPLKEESVTSPATAPPTEKELVTSSSSKATVPPPAESVSALKQQKISKIRLIQWQSNQRQKISQMKDKDAKVEAQKALDSLKTDDLSELELTENFDTLLKELELAAAAKAEKEKIAAKPVRPENGTTDPTTEQFGKTAKEGGGLLMRGVADFGELNTFMTSIPEPDTPQDKLKERKFNLEKYSYIRSDTTMRTFGGRSMGFLVDWEKVSGHILTQEGKLAISEEDVQSGSTAKPSTVADNPAITQKDVAQEFDALVTKSNETKKTNPAKMGNWNEVQILTANPDAYVGLFYAWPNTKQDYDKTFTSDKKKELAQKWFEKTGQRQLRIYVYMHRGNPKPGEAESGAAIESLGEVGASDLYLMETINLES